MWYFLIVIERVCPIALVNMVPTPSHLRVDFLRHPEQVWQAGEPVNIPLEKAVRDTARYQFGYVESTQPWLSWETDTSIQKQSAFQILLASSPQLLASNQPDCWNSGQQPSPHNAVRYAGRPLQPGHLYYWKVAVWNQQGHRSPYSKPSVFYLSPSAGARSHEPQVVSLQEPVNIQQQPSGDWFLDFGKDGFGQLVLDLSSLAADTLTLELGEALEAPGKIRSGNGNIRYLPLRLALQPGTHRYQPVFPANEARNSRHAIPMPHYIGEVFPFRYLSIHGYTAPLEKSAVQRRLVHIPFNDSASFFESDDTVLNQVWQLCKYSMKATSFTGYYVDGDRERLPYEADALINQLSHYAVDAEYNMARRSLEYLLFHPTWPTEWSLQTVLMAWNDYMYTGDARFLQDYYPDLQHKILMPLAGPDGLISTRTGKQSDSLLNSLHISKTFDGRRGLHDIVDWPQTGHYIGDEKEYAGETDGFVFCDYNAVVNAFYYKDLLLMQRIAELLHKSADAARYQEAARRVYQSYQQVFTDPTSGLVHDGDTTKHSSLHANMFALAFGLVPATRQAAVLRFIESRRMACSVYGAQFLLDALYESGAGDYALSLLDATTRRSWYNMIRQGSTITMEAWDPLFKPNLDLNHAWGAAPANIIVRQLMGVQPLSPGFDRFRIRPQPGKLKQLHLKTSCLKGSIEIRWQRGDRKDTMMVLVPGNSRAEVFMPADGKAGILWLDGKPQSIKASAGYYRIPALSAGEHQLEVR